jgi:hypothetical protein
MGLRPSDDSRLLRGSGAELGPVARRFPIDERTLLHVLRAQVAERLIATGWSSMGVTG